MTTNPPAAPDMAGAYRGGLPADRVGPPERVPSAVLLRQRPGDQPLPTPNDHTDIMALVSGDVLGRRDLGISRYGTTLQPLNGRDSLQDAYDESLDKSVYLRTLMAERDALSDLFAVQAEVRTALRTHATAVGQVDAVMAVITALMTTVAVGEHERAAARQAELQQLRAHIDADHAETRLHGQGAGGDTDPVRWFGDDNDPWQAHEPMCWREHPRCAFSLGVHAARSAR